MAHQLGMVRISIHVVRCTTHVPKMIRIYIRPGIVQCNTQMGIVRITLADM